MPWTNKTWTMSSGSEYVSFSDGEAAFHFVVNWSSITPAMAKDDIVEDADTYYLLSEFYELVKDNVTEEWADAKTEVPVEIEAVIVEEFKSVKAQQVWFVWDGVTYQNNKTTMPLYEVVDYDGNVLWTQSLVETNWKFAVLAGDDATTYTSIMTDMITQWAGKTKVSYSFSETIREGFELDNIASKWDLGTAGYDCAVDSADNLKFTLNITNLIPGTWVLIATAWDKLPWVAEWTSVDISAGLADTIVGDWEGWIYLTADAEDAIEVELTNAP